MLTSSSAVSQGKTKLPQPKSSTGNKEITIFGKDKDSGESGEEDVENTRPLAGSSIPTGGPTGPGGSIMHKDTSATAATRAKKLKPTIVLSKNASISSFFKRLDGKQPPTAATVSSSSSVSSKPALVASGSTSSSSSTGGSKGTTFTSKSVGGVKHESDAKVLEENVVDDMIEINPPAKKLTGTASKLAAIKAKPKPVVKVPIKKSGFIQSRLSFGPKEASANTSSSSSSTSSTTTKAVSSSSTVQKQSDSSKVLSNTSKALVDHPDLDHPNIISPARSTTSSAATSGLFDSSKKSSPVKDFIVSMQSSPTSKLSDILFKKLPSSSSSSSLLPFDDSKQLHNGTSSSSTSFSNRLYGSSSTGTTINNSIPTSNPFTAASHFKLPHLPLEELIHLKKGRAMLDEEILHQMGDLAALPDLPYVSPSTLTTTTTVDDNSNLPINNISELMAVVEFLNKYGHGFLKVGVNSGDADWLNFCTLEKAIFNPNSDFDLLLKIYRSLVLKSPFHRTKFKPVTFKLLQQQSSSSTIPRVRLATAAGLSSSSEHVEEKVAIITPYYLSCVFQQMANAFEATGSNKKDEEGQDSSYTAAAASASSSIDESSSSGSDMPRLQEAMEIKPVAISKSATETTATTRSEFTDDYSSPATLFRLFKNTEFALIPPLAHLSAMTLLINSIVADGPDFPTFLDKSHESVNEMRKQKTSLKVRRKDVELEIEAARVELEKMGKEMDRVEAMDCEAVADYSLGLIGSAMDTTSTIEAGSSLSLSALASSSSSTPSSDIISPHQPQAINQLAAFLKFLDSVDMSLEDQSALDSNETSADSQAVSPSSSTSALAFSSSSSDSIKASGAQLANNLKSERHFSINRANTIKSLTLRKRSKLNQMCKQYNADVTAFKLLEKEMESLSEELDEIDALIARSESIGRGSQSWELMGHDRFGRSYWWWCVTYGKLPAVSTSSSASSSPDKMQQKEHVSENVVDGDDVVMVVDDGDDDAFMTTTTLSSKKGTAETAPAHSGPSFRLSDNATVYQPPVFGVLVEHVSYRYETKETQVFVKRVAEKTNVSDEDDDDVDVHMEAVDEPDEEKSMGDHDTSSPSPTTISSPPTSSSSKEELVPFTVNSTEIFSSSTWQCIDSRNMFHRVVRSLNERGVHERKLRQALVDKWYEFGNTFPFKAASTVKLSIASTSTGGSSDASGAAAADQDRTSCWWIKWSKDHSFSSMNGVLSSNSAFKSDVEFVTDKAMHLFYKFACGKSQDLVYLSSSGSGAIAYGSNEENEDEEYMEWIRGAISSLISRINTAIRRCKINVPLIPHLPSPDTELKEFVSGELVAWWIDFKDNFVLINDQSHVGHPTKAITSLSHFFNWLVELSNLLYVDKKNEKEEEEDRGSKFGSDLEDQEVEEEEEDLAVSREERLIQRTQRKLYGEFSKESSPSSKSDKKSESKSLRQALSTRGIRRAKSSVVVNRSKESSSSSSGRSLRRRNNNNHNNSTNNKKKSGCSSVKRSKKTRQRIKSTKSSGNLITATRTSSRRISSSKSVDYAEDSTDEEDDDENDFISIKNATAKAGKRSSKDVVGGEDGGDDSDENSAESGSENRGEEDEDLLEDNDDDNDISEEEEEVLSDEHSEEAQSEGSEQEQEEEEEDEIVVNRHGGRNFSRRRSSSTSLSDDDDEGGGADESTTGEGGEVDEEETVVNRRSKRMK